MLGSAGSKTLALGIIAIGAAGASGSSGCTATKPTELVPGALTQVEVPRDLAGIKVEVLADGARKFNQSYRVVDGTAFLPATLGVLSASSASTTVTVLIGGYDTAGVMGNNFNDPTQDVGEVGATDGPRVRRGSVQTYVDQRTLFLPMPLSYSCYDTDCSSTGASSTCKAAQCLSSSTDARTLADFDPSLVSGVQDCFSPSRCFPPGATVTALPVDPANCVYEVPPGETTGPGLNVRVFYADAQLVQNPPGTGPWSPQVLPSSEEEILSVEPAAQLAEGYALVDSTNPRQFKLAPGLCSLVQKVDAPPTAPPMGKTSLVYHPVTTVQVSTACPSKIPLLPLCASEQNPITKTADGGTTTSLVCNAPLALTPAPSVVYLVMDDSSVMASAFGPQGYATATGAALANPVFKRTYVGFEFIDHKPADCTAATTPYQTPGAAVPSSLDFRLAIPAQPQLAALLVGPTPPDPATGPFAPLDLQTALRLDSGAYRHVLDFAATLGEPTAVSAVMFFLNRQPISAPAGSDGGAPDGGSTSTLTGADCPLTADAGGGGTTGVLESQLTAAAAQGLQTYFTVLGNSQGKATPLSYFSQIQTDVNKPGVLAIDATEPTSMQTQVIGRIADVVTTFGTCLYDLPPGVDTSATVRFTIPIPTPISQSVPISIPVPLDPTCAEATQATSNGWNIDGPHIRICGNGSKQLCSELRQAVEAVTAVTLVAGSDGGTTPPVPDVPVTVSMPCASK